MQTIEGAIEEDCGGKEHIVVMYSGHGVEGPEGYMVIPSPPDADNRNANIDLGEVINRVAATHSIDLLITDACHGPTHTSCPTMASSSMGEKASDEGRTGFSPFAAALDYVLTAPSQGEFESRLEGFNELVERNQRGGQTQTPVTINEDHSVATSSDSTGPLDSSTPPEPPESVQSNF